MYFIDTIPGNNKEYLLFDLDDQKILKQNKESVIDGAYCFDLYKLYNLFDEKLPFVIDLQSIYGLTLNRAEKIEDLFDESYDAQYKQIKQKIDAHIKSYLKCKIDITRYSVEDLIPKELMFQYCTQKIICINQVLKNNITEEVLSFYENKFSQIKSILELSRNEIIIDKEKKRIKYNIFGSKNSRLSIKKNSYNLYNAPKEKRENIQPPENYTLVQFDFKSFQPRLALAMFGDEEIKKSLVDTDDLYSLFEGNREDNKIELISWMFSNRKNEKFDTKLLCIKDARKKLYKLAQNKEILNNFGRPLFFSTEEENVVFQNYICSVESDCIISLIHDVCKQLINKKSYLAFSFHDCLIFCISDDEIHEITSLKSFIENYLYSRFEVNFPVSIKSGKNFGMMKNIS